MSLQQASRQLEITISEMLYQWLSREAERRAENVSSVIQAALEQHVEQHAQPFDLTKTRTWELCGAFTVAEPEAEYIVDPNETESPVTNYAEHVDDVLSEIIVDT